MPGKKDFVKFKIHEQKILILCNLKELYAAFKNKVCPKHCVAVGSSGTHSVRMYNTSKCH